MRTKWAGYREAQKRFQLGTCELCGLVPANQRHHVDRNPLNNSPENVKRLCQRCHIFVHMLDETWGRGLVQPRECVICGEFFQPERTRRGKLCGNPACLSEAGRQSAERRWSGRSKEKRCVVCGRSFIYSRPRDTTCSRSCGNRLAWARRSGTPIRQMQE